MGRAKVERGWPHVGELPCAADHIRSSRCAGEKHIAEAVAGADAHGIGGRAVTTRAEVAEAVNEARKAPGAFLLNFMVEKEDSVYPMIPAGNALHEMIRRPGKNPLVESADDE